jgi:hypothetical protein
MLFFGNDKLVRLLYGFKRKTQKFPKDEIEEGLCLIVEYDEQKNKQNGKRAWWKGENHYRTLENSDHLI